MDAVNLPSVTQILSPYVDFSKVPEHILSWATKRGKTVHNICAAICQGLWFPSVPSECVGYVESFQRWFERYVEEVVFVEKRFYHPIYQYSGQIDLYVKLEKIGYAVIDNKTPIVDDPTWKGQMAGYAELLKTNKHQLDKIGTLQLDPNGKVPKMIWYEDRAKDLNDFLAALTAGRAYHYFK